MLQYSEGEADISDDELQSLKVDWQVVKVRRHIPMRHIPMATYTHHGGHIPIMGKCLMGPMRHLPIGDIYP